MREWVVVTSAAALLVSALDAVLLQRSRGLFTGGFLSVDHLQGAGPTALFIALSLLVDAAVAGLLAAVAMWALSRAGLTRSAVLTGGFIAAVGPLILADVVSYQLLRYLGGAFDLGLMFDLTGRSVAEMFAVSSAYLVWPALIGAILVAGAAAIVWAVNRRGGDRSTRVAARALLAPVALAIAATVVVGVAVSASRSLENGLLRKPSGQVVRFVLAKVTDVDGDRFGIVGRLVDPDPWDSDVFPYAPEVPGNGIDEDGVAGDLPLASDRYEERPLLQGDWHSTPDVVLIVLESFRADLVGAHHDGKPITPVINALAARGVSSSHAYSHNGYTVQSRFHLLAGTMIARRQAPTLVDDFKAQGYAVGYFSGQDESFGSAEYDVGFERADAAYDARSDIGRRYSTFSTPGSLAIPYRAVQEQVDRFVDERGAGEKPIFLYVNFEDTHFPYSHDGIETLVSDVRLARNRIVPGEREALWATYVNTAANVDRAVGAVIDRVTRARGRAPAVVITADHGESLFEGGFLGHGYGLDEAQTRVPLVVSGLPMRIGEPFGQVDVRSALLQALSSPANVSSTPVLETTERPVFQYLGDVRSPSQIAFVWRDRRLAYDFRTRRVRSSASAKAPADKDVPGWRPLSELSEPERDAFLRLVHQWEWMNIARRRGDAPR